MVSASQATNHIQRGYAPFGPNSAHFHGWVALFRYRLCMKLAWAMSCLGRRQLLHLWLMVLLRTSYIMKRLHSPSRNRTVSCIHGCHWRHPIAQKDIPVLHLRQSSASLRLGLWSPATDAVLSLHSKPSAVLMVLIECSNCTTSLDLSK